MDKNGNHRSSNWCKTICLFQARSSVSKRCLRSEFSWLDFWLIIYIRISNHNGRSYWGYQWHRPVVLYPADKRTMLSECRTGSDSLNVCDRNGQWEWPIDGQSGAAVHWRVVVQWTVTVAVQWPSGRAKTEAEAKRCGAALNGRGTGCCWKVAGSVIKNRETLHFSSERDDNSLNVNTMDNQSA